MASEESSPVLQTSSSGIARRTWDWVRGKRSNSEQSDESESLAEKREKQRLKSKSADIPTISGESEKENRSPTEQRPASPFTALVWEDSMSNRERVQAPTHQDDKKDGKSEGDKGVKRRSMRLSSQPKGTVVYVVCGNESLASVAARFDTTITELKKFNKLMTTMIWPGQTLYVPDQDYIPSPPPSPVTPVHSPICPSSPTTDFPRAAPGLAVAVDNSAKTCTDRPTLSKRLAVEEEMTPIEQAISERFVKVHVRHITDGQGVVGGVLLVTPNAVMFDPNVSDPLVLEHGAERYGLMAPMDTILSVAMYHDIAAMKLKTNPQDAMPIKSKVYHKEHCPLAMDSATKDANDGSTPDLIKDIPGMPSGRTRTESVCSCGHDIANPLEHVDVINNEKATNIINIDTKTSEGKTNSGTSEQESREINSESGNQPCDVNSESCDVNRANTTGASSKSSQVGSTFKKQMFESQKEGSKTSTTKLPIIPEPGESNLEDLESENVIFSLSPQEQSYMDSVAQFNDKSHNVTKMTDVPTVAIRHNKEIDKHKITSRESNVDNEDPVAKSDSLIADKGDMVAKEIDSKDGTPLVTALAQGAAQDANKGLLSRTLGSLGSIPSFSNTPGFSTLVDYSSGLFARKDSKVKDIHEIDMNAPPETSNIFYVNVQNNASDSIDRVQVESAVSLDDRPELFQSLDALMPRPAAQYEDPPLYLCLRLRHAKLKGKITSPIESYTKTSFKPEYWFSIPKEKVDQLYAFFIQWSPSLYDNDEEVDPESHGFVVVDQANIDIVDDHFNPGQRLSQSWKIVNAEEVLLGGMPKLEDIVILPELLEPSNILLNDHIIQLGENLPARAEGYPWSLKYSSAKHGISLKTLYRTLRGIDSPVLLVVKDTHNQVFGAMLSCGPKVSDHFYGTGETYLFTFYQEFKIFKWSGTNTFYIKGNPESLAIGASEGSYGLWLDSDIYHGRTQYCSTFNNDVLTESEDFAISAVEAWAFL